MNEKEPVTEMLDQCIERIIKAQSVVMTHDNFQKKLNNF